MAAYTNKKFRRYLDEKKRRKEREESRKRQASTPGQEQKVPAVRKRAAFKVSETAKQTQESRNEIGRPPTSDYRRIARDTANKRAAHP